MLIFVLHVLGSHAWFVPENAADFTPAEDHDCLKNDECWKTYLSVSQLKTLLYV